MNKKMFFFLVVLIQILIIVIALEAELYGLAVIFAYLSALSQSWYYEKEGLWRRKQKPGE